MPVQIVAKTNPLTNKRYSATIPSGKPLFDHIKMPDTAVISRNGYKYQGEALEEDDLINVVLAPQGGETGKDAARTGIVIAAQVAAAIATKGMSTWAQIGLRTGVYAAANIGANALVPPRGKQ